MGRLPFTYGTVILSSDFVNRKEEIKQLEQNFRSGINSIIISPRRWGKSSLVEKVSQKLKKDKHLIICKIDLYNVRTEEEFYVKLANVVLKETASKWEDFVANAKEFLARFLPQVSLGMDNENTLKFGLSWKELSQNPDDILDLAEKIATKKNIRIVICIDEFQNIATFGDNLALQKKLRAHFQRHQLVSYCLYGSKRYMLMDVFTNTSMPFYKFGYILFLEKIKTSEWVKFITVQFQNTGKNIAGREAKLLVRLVDNHSYYVQQLAQQVWLRTEKNCIEDTVLEAHFALTQQLSLLFVNLTENLSTTQVNYLKALLCGEQKLTAKAVLEKYNLGTSANAVRLKKTLVQSELLDDVGGVLTFQDPLYKYWLEKEYFKIK